MGGPPADPVVVGEEGLTRVATRSGVAGLAARVSGILVGIVLTPFVLSGLGQNLYGILATTGSTFDYLTLLRGGLGTAMRRHVTIRVQSGRREEARRHYQAGFWWGLLLRVPILVTGLLVARPLCRFVHLPSPLLGDGALGVSLMMVAAMIIDTSAIFEVPTYATGDTSRLAATRAINSLLRLLLIPAAFWLLRPSLTAYSVAMIVLAVQILLTMGVLARRANVVGPAVPAPGLGDREIRRDLFSYGGLALLGQGAALLYVTTDNLMIGRIYGTAAVTLYSLGARWMPMVNGFVAALVQPMTPLFTKLEAAAEEERTRSAVLRSVAVTSALSIPCCLVLCVVGDLFLTRWVGPQYRAAWPILIASLAPMVLDISLSPVWTVLAGRGRIGWVSAGDMIVAVGNVVLSLVLALSLGLGLLGFALGNTAALLAKNLLLRPLAGRREPALPPMRSLFALMLRALLGGTPALALLLLTRRWYGGSLAAVLLAAGSGSVLCLIGSSLAAIGPKGLRKLAQSLRRPVIPPSQA
jgi:O-antigen/teichoic acid export membrane protein